MFLPEFTIRFFSKAKLCELNLDSRLLVVRIRENPQRDEQLMVNTGL